MKIREVSTTRPYLRVNLRNVYFDAADNAIRMDNIDRPLLIENNRVMYSGESGIEISLQNVNVPPAVVEVDIWNNKILGNDEDDIQFVDHPVETQDNRCFVIVGNLLANNIKAGIGLMPDANSHNPSTITVPPTGTAVVLAPVPTS